MFEFMGTAINNSNMELWPEEALYLLECSQLGSCKQIQINKLELLSISFVIQCSNTLEIH